MGVRLAISVLVSVFCEAGLDCQVFMAAIAQIIDGTVAEFLGYGCCIGGTASRATVEKNGCGAVWNRLGELAGESRDRDMECMRMLGMAL